MCLRRTLVSCFVVVFLLTLREADTAGNHNEFGYHGPKGPSHWADDPEYSSCAGKMQSPINIDVTKVNVTRFPPLRFRGFSAEPISSQLSNNGHTVMLSMVPSEEVAMYGGPLRGEYSFAQLHFHWGANDSVGSEDMINNHSFPMELHMVFYKSEYGSVERALKHKDGLTVLAVFYEAYDFDNTVYKEIVDHLDVVLEPKSSVQLHSLITLEDLLPTNKHVYYTYQGSLTTPPCSEVVTWIDFTEPIPLSHFQISKFRRLQSLEGDRMTENFRPVQPTGDRLIFSNIGQKEHHQHHYSRPHGKSAAISIPHSTLLCMSAVSAIKLFS